MAPPTGRTTPSDAIAIAAGRNAGKTFARRILSTARTQPGVPKPQSWRPSRVQRRRSAQATATKLLHIPAHGHAAEAADPLTHSRSDPNPAASLTPAHDPGG